METRTSYCFNWESIRFCRWKKRSFYLKSEINHYPRTFRQIWDVNTPHGGRWHGTKREMAWSNTAWTQAWVHSSFHVSFSREWKVCPEKCKCPRWSGHLCTSLFSSFTWLYSRLGKPSPNKDTFAFKKEFLRVLRERSIKMEQTSKPAGGHEKLAIGSKHSAAWKFSLQQETFPGHLWHPGKLKWTWQKVSRSDKTKVSQSSSMQEGSRHRI